MESETFLSTANTKFALALFKQFSAENSTGNIFYSPFSISAALAMVKLGAAGNTATQISEVLCFSEPKLPPSEGDPPQLPKPQTDRPNAMQSQIQTRMQMRNRIQNISRLPRYLQQCLKPIDDEENVDASFAQLLGEFNKPDALYTLNLANRLYGEQTFTFLPNFISQTEKHYNAPMETVDFSSNAEASRIHINNWVEEQTQGKITEMLSSDAVDSSTRLVLVNAIYFKGKWELPFEKEDTINDEFRLNKTDKKPVKMMQQKNKFSYRFDKEAKIQILECPYKGRDLSMIIILPIDIEDDTTGLEKLEDELTYDKLNEWTGETSVKTVHVSLPIFKMEESYDMKDVLISMGMVDAFDDSKSDFSGMSESNGLVLAKVVHKAFVDVNEEGTEAAATTAASVSERSALMPERVNADHPFLFFIKHKPSNSIFFAGRFCKPQ